MPFDNGFCRKDQLQNNSEWYRSGHNEAVLKTVCPQGHVGSNPTLSAQKSEVPPKSWTVCYNFLEGGFFLYVDKKGNKTRDCAETSE